MKNATTLYGIYKRTCGHPFTGIVVPTIEIGKKILIEQQVFESPNTDKEYVRWCAENMIDNWFIFKPIIYMNEYFEGFKI